MQADFIDSMGSDLTVVNAARVSFDSFSTELSEKDKGLIQFLARGCTKGEWDDAAILLNESVLPIRGRERILKWAKNMPTHWTPFAHAQITMRETIPIFVARQRFKHSVGFVYNEVSRRYVDDEPEFHVPQSWRERPQGNIKQGSAGAHPANDYHRGNYASFCETAQSLYINMIEDGVAPEQARMVLPQSMLTSYWVTGSLYAWANAFIQRSDSHAQREIQDLAAQWDAVIRPLFPVSWAALVD